MSDFSSSVWRGFRNTLVFGGRDTPAQFWPFAGVVLGATFVIGNVLFVIVAGVTVVMDTDLTDTAGTSNYLSGVAMPSFLPLITTTAGIALLAACLLAAAVTRRLHDREHRGGWALIPLALMLAGLVMFAFVANSFERDPNPDPTLFLINFANNGVYFVSLALLVWQLIRSGTEGENRFGGPTPRM
jgi:uncharacterized membrane protein YhaH (DUF805 family)